ncbi:MULTISPECIES: hypothetical protein [unclassified Rhizobium]|uniref:hypothetical protein n=1 Tax=unclassified Rhizobium TaxID=2613769 RepID=UPI0013588D71|nr:MULTISPECIES: hypothetical protein [unclassified Rhizobium]
MKSRIIVLSLISALSFGPPAAADIQAKSEIVPVRVGMYAPADGGCDAPAATLIFVEKNGLSANKTTGKVKNVSNRGTDYRLNVLWIEAGSSEADGEADTVNIAVKDDRSFNFSNGFTEKTLMKWCK